MPYTIKFYESGRLQGSTPWPDSFEAAKEHARDFVLIRKADRVEIYDDNNSLVFHHPRVMRAAKQG